MPMIAAHRRGSTRQFGALGPTGRAAALLGGALGMAGAAKAPRRVGVPLAVGGAYLLYRGAANRDPLAYALDLRTDGRGQIRVDRAVTINRPVAEIYALWRNIEILPRFMTHLDAVTSTGDGRSHWVARTPLGTTVAWDAELTEERPNELIAWRTLPGSEIVNEGTVRFKELPAGRGVEIRVRLDYRPPAGSAGVAMAALFGDAPDQEVREDLRRFKQLMETGEVATTNGQPSGRGPQPESEQDQPSGRSPEYDDAWAQQRERLKHPAPIDTFPKDVGNPVAEADEESFPASDAPGYAVGREDADRR